MTSAAAPVFAGRSRLRRGLRGGGRWLVDHRAQVLAAVALVAIVAGGLLHLLGADAAGDRVWRAAVALLAAELTVEVGRTVIVDRRLGVDTIALVAMLGALALGEQLAGVVIGLMFSGGAALEAAASGRARRELTRAGRARPARGAACASTTRSRRSRSTRSCRATLSSCAPARSSPSTAPWSAPKR